MSGAGVRAVLARHRPLVVVLAAGAVLRAAAAWATSPALLFTGDSHDYLASAEAFRPSLFHPFGYSALLRLLWWTDDLRVVTALQHLLGLGLGAGVYALSQRLGASRRLAAVAAVPVLLDAYQVSLERFVLAETLFECLLFAALAVLVVADRPSVAACAGGGALLAGAALTRTTGLVAVLPCLALGVARRWGWRRLAAFGVAVAAPLGAYAVWFHSDHGRFRLQGYDGRWLYGRVAPLAECDRLRVPPAERPLCDPRPVGQRGPRNFYTWDLASPFYNLPVPAPQGLDGRLPARTADDVALAFARRVILGQPADYARSVLGDLGRYLGAGRTTTAADPPIEAWQFRPRTDPPRLHVSKAGRSFESGVRYPDIDHLPPEPHRSPIRALGAYQRFGYTPGFVLAAALAVTVVACFSRRRPMSAHRRGACLVLAGSAFLLLVVAAATVAFEYRYLLPATALLMPAGAVAVESLFLRSGPAHDRP